MDDHEGTLSEITLLPDGRAYVFGLTLPLLEVLASLPAREGHWQALLEQFRAQARCSEQEAPCE